MRYLLNDLNPRIWRWAFGMERFACMHRMQYKEIRPSAINRWSKKGKLKWGARVHNVRSSEHSQAKWMQTHSNPIRIILLAPFDINGTAAFQFAAYVCPIAIHTIRTHNDRLACDAHIKIESLLAFMGYFCRQSAWALRRVRGTSTPTFGFGWNVVIYNVLLRICAPTWTELNSGVFESLVHIDRGSKWCILIFVCSIWPFELELHLWGKLSRCAFHQLRINPLSGVMTVPAGPAGTDKSDSSQKIVGFNQGSTRVLEKVDLDHHLSLLPSFVL